MNADQLQEMLENPGMLNEETAEQLKGLTRDFPWFQLGWVIYLRNLKEINSVEYESVLKNVALRISNRKQLFHYLHSKPEKISIAKTTLGTYRVGETKTGLDPNGGNHLIDRFLMNSDTGIRRTPGVENQEAEAVSADVLEKSTAEDNELVTEMLANIYFQQKKYSKAMQAYQKLSLKYPEKSVYFATRIKEIEDLKNNNQ